MEALKANELRIGNIVHWGDHYTTVDINMLRDFNVYKHGGIEGEPLTEDWLMKFGFKHTEDYFQKKSIGKNITLEFAILHKRAIVFDNKKKLFVELKFCEYVHQAQNLYFALTGTELTLIN